MGKSQTLTVLTSLNNIQSSQVLLKKLLWTNSKDVLYKENKIISFSCNFLSHDTFVFHAEQMKSYPELKDTPFFNSHAEFGQVVALIQFEPPENLDCCARNESEHATACNFPFSTGYTSAIKSFFGQTFWSLGWSIHKV